MHMIGGGSLQSVCSDILQFHASVLVLHFHFLNAAIFDQILTIIKCVNRE